MFGGQQQETTSAKPTNNQSALRLSHPAACETIGTASALCRADAGPPQPEAGTNCHCLAAKNKCLADTNKTRTSANPTNNPSARCGTRADRGRVSHFAAALTRSHLTPEAGTTARPPKTNVRQNMQLAWLALLTRGPAVRWPRLHNDNPSSPINRYAQRRPRSERRLWIIIWQTDSRRNFIKYLAAEVPQRGGFSMDMAVVFDRTDTCCRAGARAAPA